MNEPLKIITILTVTIVIFVSFIYYLPLPTLMYFNSCLEGVTIFVLMWTNCADLFNTEYTSLSSTSVCIFVIHVNIKFVNISDIFYDYNHHLHGIYAPRLGDRFPLRMRGLEPQFPLRPSADWVYDWNKSVKIFSVTKKIKAAFIYCVQLLVCLFKVKIIRKFE